MKYVVFDSNGIVLCFLNDEKEAQELADEIDGTYTSITKEEYEFYLQRDLVLSE